MRLDYGSSGFALSYVNQAIDEDFTLSEARGVAIRDRDENIVAGWVWHNWSAEAGTIEFSGAASTPRWLSRAILHELFAYAFEGLDCQMIVTRNSGDNARLHRQLTALGFSRFDIPRLFGRGENGVIWTLTKEAWQASRFYLRSKANGQEIKSPRAA